MGDDDVGEVRPRSSSDEECAVSHSTPTLTAGVDLTGRNHMIWNVLTSWVGHGVFVLAGFVLPRLLDRQLGQTALGVWDFGWSLVTYFHLTQLGVGSAVNRYVAKHRAEGNTVELNRTVSSVMCLQLGAAGIVLVLTAAATMLVPSLLANGARDVAADAQVVVLCLGLGLAVQMAFDAFRGVITGCHRWDLYNALNAGGYGATVVAMIAALALGGGLRSLAVAHLIGTAATEVARAALAQRVCPELRIRCAHVDLARARGLLSFGGKFVVTIVAHMATYQTTSLLIATHIGVAALALWSRPMALVRHTTAFALKLANVLTPTASSLDARGRRDEVRNLMVAASRYSIAIALPSVVAMALVGDLLLLMWMGPAYARADLIALLAMGHLMPIGHGPVWNVLTGLDRHGVPAVLSVVSAGISVGLAILTLGPLHWGLPGAAVAVSLPGTIVFGIVIPVYACRQLDLRPAAYFAAAWTRPLLCVVPLALCLTITRLTFEGSPLLVLAVGGGAGGAMLAVTYWRWLVPARIRNLVVVGGLRLLDRLRWRGVTGPVATTPRTPAGQRVARGGE
jgi:O-antigen/teichoic acid export membrane protein